MTAAPPKTLRTLAAAASQTVRCASAARSRPQRVILDCGSSQSRSISSSTACSSATCTHPNAAQVEDRKTIRTVAKLKGPYQHPCLIAARKRQQKTALKALSDTRFDRLMRMLAPKNHGGDDLEIKSLDEVDWRIPALTANLSRPEATLVLERYLRDRHLDVQLFLSYRNAMMAKSWPDVRRHMARTSDGNWPPFILQRAIHTVTTPSEVSDALALLATSVGRAHWLSEVGVMSTFRALRYCFVALLGLTVKQYEPASHLIPRLTDTLLALFERFPAQMASSPDLLYDFTRRCTGVPDQRARQAITRVLDWLAAQQDSETFGVIRRKVVTACILSIEGSSRCSRGKTASSAHFVNLELMERLLQHDDGADAELRPRALRCAIFAAGLDCNYQRTRKWFDEYEKCKQDNGMTMTGSDYQLLAKALVRSRQGRLEAWQEYLRAEQLFRSQIEDTAGRCQDKQHRSKADRKIAASCIELLDVMAKSDDVPLDKIFAMLGIFLQGGDKFSDGRPFVTGDRFSQAMVARRADPYAYAVVMHGLLLRRRPRCALTVWHAMLQRGVMPTTTTLSLLLQNLFLLRDVMAAMQQLQLWCEEGVPKTAHLCDKLKVIEVPSFWTSAVADIETLLPGISSMHEYPSTRRYKVVQDSVLATVVFSGLHSCRKSQGTASLWEVYQHTIQQFPDAPVLAMLLKASCPDEATSDLDAQRGRQVFRSMLFRKHPELAERHNTLKEQLGVDGAAGWIFSNEPIGGRVEKWLTSVFQSPSPATHLDSEIAVERANLDALVFTPELFEHYLRLLLHLEHSSENTAKAREARQEIVDVLSWMRHLHVTPTTTHLALTVLDIEENLPPAVAARQMDALDQWLLEWLGEQASPSQAVMQRHWLWKTRRNGQGKDWFKAV